MFTLHRWYNEQPSFFFSFNHVFKSPCAEGHRGVCLPLNVWMDTSKIKYKYLPLIPFDIEQNRSDWITVCNLILTKTDVLVLFLPSSLDRYSLVCLRFIFLYHFWHIEFRYFLCDLCTCALRFAFAARNLLQKRIRIQLTTNSGKIIECKIHNNIISDGARLTTVWICALYVLHEFTKVLTAFVFIRNSIIYLILVHGAPNKYTIHILYIWLSIKHGYNLFLNTYNL